MLIVIDYLNTQHIFDNVYNMYILQEPFISWLVVNDIKISLCGIAYIEYMHTDITIDFLSNLNKLPIVTNI